MIRLSVRTIDNVAKLIDSLSTANYTFHVWLDEYQAQLLPKDRHYTVEIADTRDGERFLHDYENANYYTLDEAKELLGIE